MTAVVAWLSGSALVSINVVTLRRARLILGWVNHLGITSRVPTPPKVLDFFSLKFQDLKSPGKSFWSWKVLEKYPWKMHIFLLVVIEKKQKYNFIHFVLTLTNLNS